MPRTAGSMLLYAGKIGEAIDKAINQAFREHDPILGEFLKAERAKWTAWYGSDFAEHRKAKEIIKQEEQDSELVELPKYLPNSDEILLNLDQARYRYEKFYSTKGDIKQWELFLKHFDALPNNEKMRFAVDNECTNEEWFQQVKTHYGF